MENTHTYSLTDFFLKVIGALYNYITDLYFKILGHLYQSRPDQSEPSTDISPIYTTGTDSIMPDRTSITSDAYHEVAGYFTAPKSLFKTPSSLIDSAFRDNQMIILITLEGITEIGVSAFHGCRSLISVDISGPMTQIEDNTFDCCTSLIKLTLPNSITVIGFYAIARCTDLLSIKLPDSLREIKFGAFEGCTSLTSITIPCGVTVMEPRAFNGCKSLLSMHFPAGLTKIGACAFEGCESLTSTVLPAGLTKICADAFKDCKGLSSIILPPKLTDIGCQAFAQCNNLQYIITNNKSFYWETIGIDTNKTVILTYSQYIEKYLDTPIENLGIEDIGPDEAYLICMMIYDLDYLPDWNALKNTFENRSIIQVRDLLIKLGKSIEAINEVIPNLEIAINGKSCSILHPIFEYMSINECDSLFDGAHRCSFFRRDQSKVGINKVDNYPFQSCTSLTTIEIPESHQNTLEVDSESGIMETPIKPNNFIMSRPLNESTCRTNGSFRKQT